jgi:hypothetical protein
MESPYLKKARKRTTLARARRLAPTHPPGPEARVRLELSRVLGKLHGEIRAELVGYASRKLLAVRDFRALLDRLLERGRSYLASPGFLKTIRDAAAAMGASAIKQVAAALGVAQDAIPTTLGDQRAAFVAGVRGIAEDRVEVSIERAGHVMDEWEDLDPETSPRARDTVALGGMLDEGLGGVMGGGLAAAALLFGSTWADMNADAQTSAGVEEYIWVAQRDGVVRPAHLDLDNAVASWRDPPLKANVSSNGEDCHAGEDYNCRCRAAPIN